MQASSPWSSWRPMLLPTIAPSAAPAMIATVRPAERAADCGSGGAEDHIGLTDAGDHAVILGPGLTGVADVAGVVFLAPAVGLGVRRRVGPHGGGQKQQQQCEEAGESAHDSSAKTP